MKIFFANTGKLRELWWVAIFFIVLAALTFPLILVSAKMKFEITMIHQAVVVIATTWFCQLMRRKPMAELTGKVNVGLVKLVLIGLILGAVLMLLPTLFLLLGRWIELEPQQIDPAQLISACVAIIAGAIAEEFLFRGFMFQRIMAALGQWSAQIILSAYFLLTHLSNPGMKDEINLLAMINIFFASMLFGLIVIRTGSLWMAIAVHAAANLTQGTVLGFGVSGHAETSIYRPLFLDRTGWLTGGSFGLEASVPGTATLFAILLSFYLASDRYINKREIRREEDIDLSRVN